MANKKNKTDIKDERIEDTTLYGEFIPSFDQWTSFERQRGRARYLEEITSELVPEKKIRTGSKQRGKAKKSNE